MKAEVAQQRRLRELVDLDADLSRLSYRLKNIAEAGKVAELTTACTAAEDEVASVGIALADLDTAIAKLETEIEAVRKREDRDRALLNSGADSKQQADLAHELETLERRQSDLEDTELEIMEQRETLAARQTEADHTLHDRRSELVDAEAAYGRARAELEENLARRGAERAELAGGVDVDLLALYERQRAANGIGAGVLQGNRCGACRIDLDRGEAARIAAAAADDVLRCPECGAILLRVTG